MCKLVVLEKDNKNPITSSWVGGQSILGRMIIEAVVGLGILLQWHCSYGPVFFQLFKEKNLRFPVPRLMQRKSVSIFLAWVDVVCYIGNCDRFLLGG